MAGYVMRQFTCPKAVTHPSNNRARCRATALIETKALPLHQTAKLAYQTYSSRLAVIVHVGSGVGGGVREPLPTGGDMRADRRVGEGAVDEQQEGRVALGCWFIRRH